LARPYRAIKVAEDRLWFKDACRKIGLEVPASALVNNAQDALRLCDQLGFPLVIRPSFTLGGTGGSIAYNREEFGEAHQTARQHHLIGPVFRAFRAILKSRCLSLTDS